MLMHLYRVTASTNIAAHYHPEAPGTPWPTSPPLETVHIPDDDQAASARTPVEHATRIPVEDVSVAADANPTKSLHTSTSALQPLPAQSPAAVLTTDVDEDPQAEVRPPPSATWRSPDSDGAGYWPSASEMTPYAFRKYIESMQIPKPKPRPRRKHFDRKLERQRLRQELENTLARRAELMSLEEASSAPPVMQAPSSHGRDLIEHDSAQRASASVPPVFDASQHPLYAGSTFSSETVRSADSDIDLRDESVEEEISRLNESVEALMISISELDKLKDPQIELSFTGPKAKNLQRARPDDELWTDLTGRAPGIVSLRRTDTVEESLP